jgi:hypothetical protein
MQSNLVTTNISDGNFNIRVLTDVDFFVSLTGKDETHWRDSFLFRDLMHLRLGSLP